MGTINRTHSIQADRSIIRERRRGHQPQHPVICIPRAAPELQQALRSSLPTWLTIAPTHPRCRYELFRAAEPPVNASKDLRNIHGITSTV